MPPALLKVFIEMVFSSGFAYKYKESPRRVTWEKKLKGKSARILTTMDAPVWYYKWVVGDPSFKMMRKGVLNFCGVKPVYKNYFGSVKMSSKKQRKKWLEKIYKVGLNE
jgi:putative NADPH-quinone reductase